ncbi:MAG: PQQ-binding-like beta-propeller repeat protein [Planctomycetaceae bacterium]|nr:PQQ-binding-like beta-propeller repeat protein [Planctomycetaceae bacterium]
MNRSLIFCLSLSFSTIVCADWPEFRGPSADGISTAKNLAVEWSATSNITWKSDLPGLAWSSPVIANGKIYLTTAVKEEEEYSLRALRLDAKTGNVEWDNEIFRQPEKVQIHKKNSHASPSPIVEGDRLYVHYGPHGTACLKLDGSVVWKQTLEYEPQHGNGGSPALIGDVLVICCDGRDVQYVAGVDKATGNIRWKTDRETEPAKGFSFCTPLILDVNGQPQAICPGSEAVFAYDPQTGKEIWHCNYPGGYSVTPRPIFGSGLVFVCTGYDKPKLLAIDPTGKGDVTETHLRWETDKAAPHAPSLIHADGLVYLVSDRGIASCLDARSGEEIWQHRIGGNFSASPLYAEGRVYFQDENGVTTVVQAGREYEEIARNELVDERTYASYAVDGSAIFLRSENSLYRIEKQ